MATTLEELRIKIEARAANLDAQLSKIERRLQRTARAFESAGRRLTIGLTAPVLALGGAATKMAVTFDDEMNKLVSLVGLPREEVEKLKAAVLNLAPTVGRSPLELARALFPIASAGNDAAKSLEILEVAAKAAAIGMGTTEDAGRVLNKTLANFDVDTIEEAAGILIAIAKAADANPNALAEPLARILPVARAAGIELRTVGGEFAVITRGAGNADIAATAMVGAINAITKPADNLREKIRLLGLPLEKLRKILAEEGLIAAVKAVEKVLGSGTQAFDDFFKNIRGALGVNILLAAEIDKVDAAVNAVAASGIPTFTTAFKEAQRSALFPFRQQLARVQADLIKLGTDTAPLVLEAITTLVDLISRLSDRFQSLDPHLRQNIIRWVALVALAGPVLLFVGILIRLFGSLIGLVRSLALAFLFLAANPVVAAAILLGTALGVIGGLLASNASGTDILVAAQRRHETILRKIVRLTKEATTASGERAQELIAEKDALIQLDRAELGRLKSNLQAQLLDADFRRRKRAGRSPTSGRRGTPGDIATGLNIAGEIANLEQQIAAVNKLLDALKRVERKARQVAKIQVTSRKKLTGLDPGGVPTGPTDKEVEAGKRAIRELELEFLRSTGRMREVFAKLADEQIKKFEELRAKGIISQEDVNLAISRIESIRDANVKAFEDAQQAANQLGEALNQAFQNAILQARNFGDVLRSIKNLLVSALLFGPEGKSGLFGGALSGLAFSLGSLFGKQGGGDIQPGVPTLVHKNEIIIPKVPSTVRNVADSRRMLGGRGISVVQHITFAVDVRNSIRAEVLNTMPAAAALAVEAIGRASRGIR